MKVPNRYRPFRTGLSIQERGDLHSMNHVVSNGTRTSVLFYVIMLAACSEHARSIPAVNTDMVECREPRPEMCTQEYRPVCATRDNGVRCVTTPCDSTEDVTYSNGCMACADPSVYFFRADACVRSDGAAE